MVLDDSRAYAFRSEPLGNMLHPRTRYQLYAADKDPARGSPGPTGPPGRKKRREGAGKASAAGDRVGGCKIHWQVGDLPLLANAMTITGENLFLAGPPDVADETTMLGYLPGARDEINRQLEAQDAAWHGELGGLLWVVATEDGRKLAQYKLPSYPRFDGMSAARGGLYMSMIDGSVVKYEAKR
jgi:hypothetical protein